MLADGLGVGRQECPDDTLNPALSRLFDRNYAFSKPMHLMRMVFMRLWTLHPRHLYPAGSFALKIVASASLIVCRPRHRNKLDATRRYGKHPGALRAYSSMVRAGDS